MLESLLTFEEYEQLTADSAYRDELSRGQVVREPRPGLPHARVQVRVAAILHFWVENHGLGFVSAEGGFKLEHDPDTLRGPDVAFVAKVRYGDMLPKKWADFAPDLIVEILSPSDRVSRMAEKVAQYFAAGTRLVWLIDPEDRVAIVYHSAADADVIREDAELDGENVLPGFRCTLRELLD